MLEVVSSNRFKRDLKLAIRHWLLIYQIQEDALVLFLSRTGTHSDLFS